MSDWRYPSDAAIRVAQAAYDRGELTLLEAAFFAEIVDVELVVVERKDPE